MKSCLEQEQQAYDGIKAMWSTVMNLQKKFCREVAEGSYFVLHACIVQEQEAKEGVEGFKFKR